MSDTVLSFRPDDDVLAYVEDRRVKHDDAGNVASIADRSAVLEELVRYGIVADEFLAEHYDVGSERERVALLRQLLHDGRRAQDA